MSPDLILLALLVGIILGWQARLAVTAFVTRRRDGSSGPAQFVGADLTQPELGAAGPELDLRDTRLYDQATDPGLELAGCPACRGRGRLWLFDTAAGRSVPCPCGTPIHNREHAV